MTAAELRSIDEQVHREVRGLDCERATAEDGGELLCVLWRKNEVIRLGNPVPHYTLPGCLLAMVLLDEWADDCNGDYKIERRNGSFGVALRRESSLQLDQWEASQPTLPLAICTALLDATRYLEEKQ